MNFGKGLGPTGEVTGVHSILVLQGTPVPSRAELWLVTVVLAEGPRPNPHSVPEARILLMHTYILWLPIV